MKFHGCKLPGNVERGLEVSIAEDLRRHGRAFEEQEAWFPGIGMDECMGFSFGRVLC